MANVTKKTRKSISLKIKCEILKDLDNNLKSKEIFGKFGINKSTLYKIKNQRQKIEDFASNSLQFPKNVKKIKNTKFPLIEIKLYQWFLQEREKKNTVNDMLLQLKAMAIQKELNVNPEFKASQGFLTNFKKRHGIRLKTISGELLSCDESMVQDWKDKFKNVITELNLVPEQLYNADESGLIYKNLDSKTLVAGFEKTAPGRKNSKERVTIMLCSNATGSHKLPLMMIGKSKNPRAFKNWQNILYYKSSKNAWQTTFLFKEWFFNEFVPSVRKHFKEKKLPERALLLLDNASSHSDETELQTEDGNIKVMFFPPNTTPILQPMDQNVIRSTKIRYRRSLLLYLGSDPGIDALTKLKQINLKDVIYMIVQA